MVPPAVLVNAMLGAVLLQIVTAEGVAVITGIGFTVTTAVAVAVQLLAVPVIVYVAVPAVLLLLLVSVCAIGVPELDEPPLMVPVCATVQV